MKQVQEKMYILGSDCVRITPNSLLDSLFFIYFTKSSFYLNQIKELLYSERENVLDTIPLVEADSRLGWEPRMDYVCDRSHLEWKLRQLSIAEAEIEAYEEMIKL